MRLNYLTAFVSLSFIIAACSKPTVDPPTPVAPGCSGNITPSANGFVINNSSVTFTWESVTGATAYDVYLGISPVPTALIANNVTSTTFNYTLPTPAANTTYYWYVVPKGNNVQATGCTGKITSFTYINVQAPSPFGYYVVGYFPSYRNPAEVPDQKFRMTNVAIYAFFGVNSSGTLTVNSPSTLDAFITKAKANNAKVFVGINDGSGDGKSYFKNMASTQAGRTTFVKDVMVKVRQYQFHGVDMDWEYPTTSDGTDITFTALMKELADSLHRDAKYYLSTAITAGKYAGGARDAIKAELFPIVDFFNIMAYDDFSTTTPYKHHSDYALAQTCLNYWITTRGMPSAKTVLGIPLYGRPSGITQSGTILTYRQILSQGGSSLLDSAKVTGTDTVYKNYTIYYNGQPTVKKKAMLAKSMANGVMFWEKWQDAMDDRSLIKAACDTIGRAY